MVFCPVVAVVMLESRMARCVHCEEEVAWLATRISSITTATTGQKTIGSETQSDLLMMGIKTPETCWGIIKSLIVASSWSRLHLRNKTGLDTKEVLSCYFDFAWSWLDLKAILREGRRLLHREIWGSQSDAAEDTSLLRCDAVSTGRWYGPFRRTLVFSSIVWSKFKEFMWITYVLWFYRWVSARGCKKLKTSCRMRQGCGRVKLVWVARRCSLVVET